METGGGRRSLVLITLGLGFVVISLLSLRSPSELAIPPCPFHWMTGLHCPGCGSLRAAHFLLQGEWLLALRYNLLAVVLAPIVAWLFLGETLSAFGRRSLPRTVLPAGGIWILLVGVLLFGVVRNLPAAPFHHLAPPAAAAGQPDSPR